MTTPTIDETVTWLRDKCEMRMRANNLADAAWLADSANKLEAAFAMLERFAEYGEELWDVENFRDGYKKINSGLLVDCRKLLKENKISLEQLEKE